MLKQYDLALEAYLRTVRVANLRSEDLADDLLLQRIGSILVK
jgi:tetratricopeptide (TPR) repeat protein